MMKINYFKVVNLAEGTQQTEELTIQDKLPDLVRRAGLRLKLGLFPFSSLFGSK